MFNINDIIYIKLNVFKMILCLINININEKWCVESYD